MVVYNDQKGLNRAVLDRHEVKTFWHERGILTMCRQYYNSDEPTSMVNLLFDVFAKMGCSHGKLSKYEPKKLKVNCFLK